MSLILKHLEKTRTAVNNILEYESLHLINFNLFGYEDPDNILHVENVILVI